MPTYRTPGVYQEEVFPRPAAGLRVGVPAFLGLAQRGPVNLPRMLTLWTHFGEAFGSALSEGYLGYAVRGFFENQGRLCYAVRLEDNTEGALQAGLDALSTLDAIDLVCAPDVMWQPELAANPQALQSRVALLQTRVLDHCDALGDRFAILDSLPDVTVEEVLRQRQGLGGMNGALYYPWVRPADGPAASGGFVPPCGHIAGVYARTDEQVGVHKAPANEVLAGVLDLEVNLKDSQQGRLHPEGVNCLRVFSGRGIRVWGARTVSADPAWTHVSVRRLFLTASRWIERNLTGAVLEPNDQRLWARINRELTSYFNGLFQRGALKGSTPEEAFYIKCDSETNPPEVRDAGMVVTEIGLAPGIPNEFVVVRIIHGASGVTISGPAQPV